MVMELRLLYLRILYFKVYAPRYINTYVCQVSDNCSSHITDTAYWLVRPLYSVYSLKTESQVPFQLLGKFEFDGHRTHEHAVTHRSL